eukprot:6178016-Pleurochrysis_carterae.AAC.1
MKGLQANVQRSDQTETNTQTNIPSGPIDVQKFTEQPLLGRARAESAARTDSYIPRTPESGVLYLLILYGSLPELLPSGRAGANEFTLGSVGGWEQARARGLRRACAVALGQGGA